ncbi:thioredoxin domain-containing protein [Halorubrum ezzemoulense]|uniref:thioredoxin domain-containing protein n=1 Tax=Halorubrum ezzemoulense TaxID=337243 RepID=UPI00232C85C4|nr:thioredoxin domain-containing protein [Halorubrum ezzemoulense]MDB2259900.1 thioredoxin domain-containing protein [Halorubrum ezzemoulense]MDB2266866.1 thioredoxin domain-containing protein [Halorubrum ezzemoulense]
MSQPTERNRLDGEASPYLRQHADNPVNWQPWGDAAFERAREHDAPVFVSIGYSSCHWCHVMAEESFEDESVAAVVNDSFVPIKVDREERPDVDSTFMTVSQLVTGGGGWPLSAWCTPEGKPFYVGTYFPPEPRRNQPGFRELCERIADSWSDPEQREEMERRADQWAESARDELESVPTPEPPASEEGGPSPPGDDLLDTAAAAALRGYDEEHGGFGSGGAKFPMPGRIDLLMRAYAGRGRDALLSAATGTLDGMADGGMYDQIGGGFHRYAVDREWTVPHFEKMLYDNAELPMVYLDGYRLTGDPRYARVASESLAFLDRELRHEGGAFFSTLDARSRQPASRRDDGDASRGDGEGASDGEDVEGAFYVWTPEEVDAVLDEPAASLAKERYGIRPGGNFERGTTVPTVAASVAELAADREQSPEAVRETLTEARTALFDARESRPRPARDEKVLAAWNGRAISAFARAGDALGEPYAESAREALDFCRDRLYDPDAETGALARRWLDGDVRGPGYLDDYAFLARGALDTYAATGDPEALGFALDLADALVAEFYDADDDTIYFTRDLDGDGGAGERADAGPLIARPQEFTDRSTPSSLGVAAETLALLDGFRTGGEFREIAERVVTTHADRIRGGPLEHASLVRAADLVETGGIEVTVAADEVPDEWRETLGERYLPGALVAPRPATDAGLDEWLDRLDMVEAPPIWADRDATDGEPTAYVCEGFACSPPRTDLDAALAWLGGDE